MVTMSLFMKPVAASSSGGGSKGMSDSVSSSHSSLLVTGFSGVPRPPEWSLLVGGLLLLVLLGHAGGALTLSGGTLSSSDRDMRPSPVAAVVAPRPLFRRPLVPGKYISRASSCRSAGGMLIFVRPRQELARDLRLGGSSWSCWQVVCSVLLGCLLCAVSTVGGPPPASRGGVEGGASKEAPGWKEAKGEQVGPLRGPRCAGGPGAGGWTARGEPRLAAAVVVVALLVVRVVASREEGSEANLDDGKRSETRFGSPDPRREDVAHLAALVRRDDDQVTAPPDGSCGTGPADGTGGGLPSSPTAPPFPRSRPTVVSSPLSSSGGVGDLAARAIRSATCCSLEIVMTVLRPWSGAHRSQAGAGDEDLLLLGDDSPRDCSCGKTGAGRRAPTGGNPEAPLRAGGVVSTRSWPRVLVIMSRLAICGGIDIHQTSTKAGGVADGGENFYEK